MVLTVVFNKKINSSHGEKEMISGKIKEAKQCKSMGNIGSLDSVVRGRSRGRNRSRFACQGSPLLCAQNIILLGVRHKCLMTILGKLKQEESKHKAS